MSGDENTALFEALYPGLRRFASVVRPPEVDPDDLVQEALVRVLASGALDTLTNPRAYLCQTMVRLAANHRRGLGRARRGLTRLQPPAGSVPIYPSDLDELLRLPPGERAVLYLTIVEELSYREAAIVLGCREDAARTRAARALRRLRVLVGEDD